MNNVNLFKNTITIINKIIRYVKLSENIIFQIICIKRLYGWFAIWVGPVNRTIRLLNES